MVVAAAAAVIGGKSNIHGRKQGTHVKEAFKLKEDEVVMINTNL